MVQYSRRKVFGESDKPIEAHQKLEIAEGSKAVYFLSGDLNEIDGNKFATWSLVDVRTGDNITGGTSKGENLFVIADGIKDEVLTVLNELVGADQGQTIMSVTEVTTDVPEAYDEYMAGISAWQNYSHAEAIIHLEKAIALDSTFALTYLALSQVMFDNSSRGGLVHEYADMAVRYKSGVSPKDRLRIEIWKANYGGGAASVSETTNSYEQILKYWPDDLETHREITSFSYYEWFFLESARYAERGLTYYPDDVLLRTYLAIGLHSSMNNERALHEGRINIEMFPDYKNQWDNLGLIYLAAAKPDSADLAFRKALEIDPEFYASIQGLAFSAYCRGELDQAIDKIELLLSEVEMSPATRRQIMTDMRSTSGLAALYVEAGQYNAAIGVFKEARQQVYTFRENSRLERERFLLLLRLGQAEEILKVSQMFLTSAEDDDQYLRANGLTYKSIALVALDSLEAAKESIGELYGFVDYAGGYVSVVINMLEAQIAADQGDYGKALTGLTALIESKLGYAGGLRIYVMGLIAGIHETSEKPKAAIETHKEILHFFGGHALSHYELGRLYEKLGQPNEAKAHYTRFLEMWKNADEGLPQREDARARLAKLSDV